MTQDNTSGWPKRISVDKRIVSLLSRSTYEKFPMALRETVSNAYDADATVVEIVINLNNRQITIEDNGIGMTPEEFDFYLRIAGQKRGKTESIKFKRRRIGQLGVGFLSVFPFCTTLEIKSKAENSDKVFTARIPSKRFMEESSYIEDVGTIPVEGFETIDPKERSKHYTIIRLVDISPLVDEYFKPKSLEYKQSDLHISSWEGFKRLRWELQETLPLDFPEYSSLSEALGQKPTGMEVRLNGERLYRNESGGEILENNQGKIKELGDIKFRYAITTNWEPIHPYNARGLKVRLKNVGVGERTYFDLGIRGRTWSRLHWITGEVHIQEGLDEAIALDRDSFTWSNSYEEFRDFFRSILYDIAQKIEDVASSEKKIKNVIESPTGPVKDMVEKYLEKLPKEYEIIREKKETSKYKEPIYFDKKNKRVIVVEDHEVFTESITLAGKKFSVSYNSWNYLGNPYPACRIDKDGNFEINLAHPVLKKSKYGEVFIKLNLILLMARTRSNNQIEMYEYIMEKMTEEFG
jgi:hypothetical protein